jgi:protein-disulfide isomerase
MTEALDKQQADAQNVKVQTAISENADLIFRDKYGLEAGNPKGDVTIVEFSDYNCPYCKRAYSDVEKLIKSDKNVRFVMKEFPIFGERSESAARVAIAARKQGKYMELHAAMMNNRGPNNGKVALKLAEELGFDMDKLREDMKSDEARKIIEETRILGNKLGIQGTPFFLIGDQTIPGAGGDAAESGGHTQEWMRVRLLTKLLRRFCNPSQKLVQRQLAGSASFDSGHCPSR